MMRRFCAIALVTLSLAACGKAAPTAPTTTATTSAPAKSATPAAPQVLRVATEGNFPPFNYMDANGALVGFDVDIAKELCTRLKARCDISLLPWDSFIMALQYRKVDVIVASMTPTEVRKKYIAFTDPYYRVPLQLVGAKGLSLPLDSTGAVRPDALRNKRVMVLSETAAERYARKAFPDATIVSRGLEDEWASAVSTGDVDLALEDLPIVDMALKQLSELAAYGTPIVAADAATTSAIAAQKDNPDLVAQLNAALEQIRADGTFAKIAQRYALQSVIVP